MQTGTTVMDKPLWVPMDEQERKGHVDQLLRHLTRVDELEQALSAFQKKQRGLISAEMLEIHRLRRVLADDGQQMTLADAKIDDVPTAAADPTTPEAAAVLAEVAKRVETRWHKDGKLCASDTCKRRHVPELALRNAGVEPEQPGAAAEESPQDGPPKCVGCTNELTATEIVKKLGLCETCQTQPAGVDPMAGTPEATAADASAPLVPPSLPHGEVDDADRDPDAIEAEMGEDPRPRCSCGAVLSADEVEKGLGLCQACIDGAGGEEAAPESEEQPTGEAGA